MPGTIQAARAPTSSDVGPVPSQSRHREAIHPSQPGERTGARWRRGTFGFPGPGGLDPGCEDDGVQDPLTSMRETPTKPKQVSSDIELGLKESLQDPAADR